MARYTRKKTATYHPAELGIVEVSDSPHEHEAPVDESRPDIEEDVDIENADDIEEGAWLENF